MGDGVPVCGSIDTNVVMHKWELIKETNWRPEYYEDDWQLVEGWLKLGKTFSWVNKVTCNYYVKDDVEGRRILPRDIEDYKI